MGAIASESPAGKPLAMNRTLKLITSALSALCLSLPVWAAEGGNLKFSAEQIKASGIVIRPLGPPQAGQAQTTLPGQMQVPNNQMQAVAAPFAGQVVQVGPATGETVRKGRPLLRLASPALVSAQRDYLQAQSQAKLASQTAERDELLYKEGIIADARRQASRSAQQQANAAAAERRRILELSGLGGPALTTLSGEAEILSPLDGEVLEQSVSVGQRVEQGALLYRIGRLSPLWLEIQAPVALMERLRVGAAVKIKGLPASGHIITVSRRLDNTSQTLPLRALIDQGADRLHPGQFVEAELALPGAGASWPAPTAAIVRHQDKTWVFVQRGNQFHAVAVRLAGSSGNDSLITAAGNDSLKADDQIAVQGLAALKAAWMGN